MPAPSRPGSLSARLNTTRRLLVIEDEQDLARMLQAWFGVSGWSVDHCDPDDIDQAVQHVAEQRPEAIVLDIGLRGIDGADVYASLRRNPDLADTPIIVITGAATTAEELGLAERDGFVPKPFSAEVLEHVVIDLDRRRHQTSNDAPASPAAAEFPPVPMFPTAPPTIAGQHAAVALLAITNTDAIEARCGHDAIPFVTARLAEWIHKAMSTTVLSWAPEPGELVISAATLTADQLCAELRDALSGGIPVMMPSRIGVTIEAVAGVADGRDPDVVFSAADAALARARSAGAGIHIAS